MNAILVFFALLIVIAITGLKFRIPAFFTLTAGAIVYSIIMGNTADAAISMAVGGMASVFEILGVPILAGSVIAKLLLEQGMIEDLVSDIRRVIKNSAVLSGIFSFFFAIPTTCPISSFIILAPFVGNLESDKRKKIGILIIAAVAATLGTSFFYPTPVVYPIFEILNLNLSPLVYDAVAIPVALFVLGILIAITLHKWKKQDHVRQASALDKEGEAPTMGTPEKADAVLEPLPDNGPMKTGPRVHLRAWAPMIAMLLSVPLWWTVIPLSHLSIVQAIMLVGMITALLVARREVRHTGFILGAKHAGVIIFDVCGAGALGMAITQSSFASETLPLLTSFLPAVFIPFALAALLQTAQGSRIVTSIVTAQMLAGSLLVKVMNPLAFVLMVGAGACVVSFVTDPFFWVIQKETGQDQMWAVKYYTLPLALIGCAIGAVAFCIQVFFP
jgi:GntP family gluconate:H+ symporter